MSALHRQLPGFAFAGVNKHQASHTKPTRQPSTAAQAQQQQQHSAQPPQIDAEQDAVPGYN